MNWTNLTFQSDSAAQFECPARDGQYIHEEQCDKYYVCIDGEAEEMLCEDGLVFDPFKRTDYKCDLPSLVDCSGREALRKRAERSTWKQNIDNEWDFGDI